MPCGRWSTTGRRELGLTPSVVHGLLVRQDPPPADSRVSLYLPPAASSSKDLPWCTGFWLRQYPLPADSPSRSLPAPAASSSKERYRGKMPCGRWSPTGRWELGLTPSVAHGPLASPVPSASWFSESSLPAPRQARAERQRYQSKMTYGRWSRHLSQGARSYSFCGQRHLDYRIAK